MCNVQKTCTPTSLRTKAGASLIPSPTIITLLPCSCKNLFWAFIYNIIGIPIAAGVFYNLFGLRLDAMIGSLCMSLSSVCVVMIRQNFIISILY